MLSTDVGPYLANARVVSFKLHAFLAITTHEIDMINKIEEYEKSLSVEGELVEMEDGKDKKRFLNVVSKAETKFKDALDKHLFAYKKKNNLEGPLSEEEQEFWDEEKTDWVREVDDNFSKFRLLLPSPAASTTQRANPAKIAKTTPKNARIAAKSKKRRSATGSSSNPYTKEYSNKRKREESTQAEASNVL